MKKLALAFLLFTIFSPPEDCSLRRNQDGVKVYTCKSKGERLKSLKAEFVLENITIDELVVFLNDVPNYTTWQYNMVEASILRRESPESMVYRTLVEAPWPVDNRELIVRYTLKRNPAEEALDIIIQSIDYDYPLTNGVVRIPESYATWHVVTQGKSLKIEYALRVDPGGSVPAWLVNIAMADGPHHSFRNLKKQLDKK